MTPQKYTDVVKFRYFPAANPFISDLEVEITFIFTAVVVALLPEHRGRGTLICSVSKETLT